MADLGVVYVCRDKLDEAERMFQGAILGRAEGVGRQHISWFRALKWSAEIHASLGRLDEAEEALIASIEGYERVFGPDHPRTLAVAERLGQVLLRRGKLDAAKDRFQRVLEEYQKKRMATDDDMAVARVAQSLAAVYAAKADLDAAAGTCRRAFELRVKEYGPEDERTLDSINSLRDYATEDEFAELSCRIINDVPSP
jgi:tetratricopeptide (TPR) repeat protein